MGKVRGPYRKNFAIDRQPWERRKPLIADYLKFNKPEDLAKKERHSKAASQTWQKRKDNEGR